MPGRSTVALAAPASSTRAHPMLCHSIALPRCVHLQVHREVLGWIDGVRSTSYRPVWCPTAIAASTHPSDSNRPVCCEPTPRSSRACHIAHGTLPEWKHPGLGVDSLCTARLIGCSLQPPIGRHSVPDELLLLPGLTVPGRSRRPSALHRGQACCAVRPARQISSGRKEGRKEGFLHTHTRNASPAKPADDQQHLDSSTYHRRAP